LSIETLSDVPLFAGRPSHRVPPKRKAAAWIATGLVQLFLLNVFVLSDRFTDFVRHGSSTEITLQLPGAVNSNRDREPMPEQQTPNGVPPEVVTRPIVVPPPPNVTIEEPKAPPAISDGDLLGAIGRDVACKAGNYENLTTAERGRCPRIPWEGARLPNGAIVLQTPPPRNRFFEEPPPPEVISGADAQRRAAETAGSNGACPIMLNTPCFNKIPGRN
jgi:hypothetical protein